MTRELFAVPREPVLSVAVEVRDRGSGSEDRYEASLADFSVLQEVGRTPWEAINRLVAGHRGLLERRWSL